MSSVVELAGVDVVRGGAKLLNNVTWTVDEGQRWVIIGPNGAGKTTLMQVLSAQIHPTAGVVGLLDEVLGAVDVFELRPRIGVSSAAIAERIPRGERVDDVVMSASYAVMGRWREEYDPLDLQRADQLLRQLRVDHLRTRTFGTLSEGERKRVQIARALMTDPELLLLDEPAAGLNFNEKQGLMQLIRRIRDLGVAVVLIEHDMGLIMELAERIVVLNYGKEIAVGTPEQIKHDPVVIEAYLGVEDEPLDDTKLQTGTVNLSSLGANPPGTGRRASTRSRSTRKEDRS